MAKTTIIATLGHWKSEEDARFLLDAAGSQKGIMVYLRSFELSSSYQESVRSLARDHTGHQNTGETTQAMNFEEHLHAIAACRQIKSISTPAPSLLMPMLEEGYHKGLELDRASVDALIHRGDLNQAINYKRRSLQLIAAAACAEEELMLNTALRVAYAEQQKSWYRGTILCAFKTRHKSLYSRLQEYSHIRFKGLVRDQSNGDCTTRTLTDMRSAGSFDVSNVDLARSVYERPIAAYLMGTTGMDSENAIQKAGEIVASLTLAEMTSLAGTLARAPHTGTDHAAGANVRRIGEQLTSGLHYRR